MPVYKFRHPQTKQIIKIRANRQPTNEEAVNFMLQMGSPPEEKLARAVETSAQQVPERLKSPAEAISSVLPFAPGQQPLDALTKAATLGQSEALKQIPGLIGEAGRPAVVGGGVLKPVRELSPEEQELKPVFTGRYPALHDIGVGSAEFINQQLGGIPNNLLKKAGFIVPEPLTLGGQALRETTFGAGVALGLPVKASLKLSQAMFRGKGVFKLFTKLPTSIKAGITGFMAEFARAQDEKSGDIIQLKSRAIRGTIAGALATAAAFGTKFIANRMRNATLRKNPIPLAREVRSAAWSGKRNMSENFGKVLDEIQEFTPGARTDISNSLTKQVDLGMLDDTFPPAKKFIGILKRTKIPGKQLTLYDLAQNPELAKNLTIRETQQIVNSLGSKLPKGKLAGSSVRPDDGIILDFIDDIRSDQLAAFPRLADLRASYAESITEWDSIKNLIIGPGSRKSLLPAITSGRLTGKSTKFVGSREIQQSIRSFLPSSLIDKMGSFANSVRLIQGTKKVVGLTGVRIAVAAGAAGAFGYLYGKSK